VDVRAQLIADLAQRRAANPRYSLRAFARRLGVDHSVLSQLLRGRRNLSRDLAAALAKSFGWTSAEIDAAVAADEEARLLTVVGSPTFRADARWLAARLALPIDRVQILLQRLLRSGKLHLTTPSTWTHSGDS
jgi:transcriptional regulator with XRE-family HTH domain